MDRQRSREKKSKNIKIQDIKRQQQQKYNLLPTHKSEKQQIIKYHKFIRNQSSQQQSQQQIQGKQKHIKQIVKKQYDQLYKQFAIVDLSKYQTGKIGCRWRLQQQVIKQKGDKYCAEMQCRQMSQYTFQMNFGYVEQLIKKNALVKVSVCKNCADKLNYKKKLKMLKHKAKTQ